MANAQIPLMVNQVDPISPLLMLQQGRQHQAQAAQQQQERQYQQQRQQNMDRLTIADLGQQREARNLQMEGQKIENTAKKSQFQREALQFIARDAIAFDNLVQAGDLQSAAILGQEIKRTASENGLPLQGIDQMLTLFNSPEALKAESAKMRRLLEPQLRTLFQDVKNEQGQLVGQRNTDTGQLSGVPEGMRPQQVNALDTYIKGLEIQEQQLQNQRLTAQIGQDAQAATIRQTEADTKATENSQRQNMLANEQIRIYDITKRMLANESGLSGATGPVSSRLPSFRQGTVDFEADFNELGNLLTMQNLGRMTGVLSNSDLLIIRNAASGLAQGGSEERMKTYLQQINDVFSRNPAVVDYIQGQQNAANGGGAVDRSAAIEQTATNPQTGERVVLRNGQWVPL